MRLTAKALLGVKSPSLADADEEGRKSSEKQHKTAASISILTAESRKPLFAACDRDGRPADLPRLSEGGNGEMPFGTCGGTCAKRSPLS